MSLDLATYNGPTAAGRIKGDLALSPGRNDLALGENSLEILLTEIIEAFDQPPGDDLDFPWLSSRQQAAFEGQTRADLLARVQDARRIMSEFREVDQNSIDISVDDNGDLFVEFRAGGVDTRVTV